MIPVIRSSSCNGAIAIAMLCGCVDPRPLSWSVAAKSLVTLPHLVDPPAFEMTASHRPRCILQVGEAASWDLS